MVRVEGKRERRRKGRGAGQRGAGQGERGKGERGLLTDPKAPATASAEAATKTAAKDDRVIVIGCDFVTRTVEVLVCVTVGWEVGRTSGPDALLLC